MKELDSPRAKRRFGCGQVVLLMVLTAVLSGGAVLWWAKTYLYASELRPVALDASEQQVLEDKLERLEEAAVRGRLPEAPAEGRFPDAAAEQDPDAEPYAEDPAAREIELSERELNALIARNDADAARHVAIDLSRDLVSLKVIVPMEAGTPIVGGKTIRIRAGLEVRMEGGRARVLLKGVSLGGVPLPNAWLGNRKGKDFLEEFGEGSGFWKQFSEGIAHIEIGEGRLKVVLQE